MSLCFEAILILGFQLPGSRADHAEAVGAYQQLLLGFDLSPGPPVPMMSAYIYHMVLHECLLIMTCSTSSQSIQTRCSISSLAMFSSSFSPRVYTTSRALQLPISHFIVMRTARHWSPILRLITDGYPDGQCTNLTASVNQEYTSFMVSALDGGCGGMQTKLNSIPSPPLSRQSHV